MPVRSRAALSVALALGSTSTQGCSAFLRSEGAEYLEPSPSPTGDGGGSVACSLVGAPRYLKAPRPVRSSLFGAGLAAYGDMLIASAFVEEDGISAMRGTPETPCHPEQTLPADTTGAGVTRVYGGAPLQLSAPAAEIRNGPDSPALVPTTDLGGTAALGLYSAHPVAVGADHLAIGDAGVESFRGAVRLFDRRGGVFAERPETLGEADTVQGDAFGMALSIDGSVVAVGAPGDDARATNGGAAYVYDLAQTPPVRLARLDSPEPQESAWFGVAVTVSPGWIFVAATGEDNSPSVPSDDGAVYAFRRNGSTIDATPRVLDKPPRQGFFGATLAVDGDLLAVGAPGADGPTGVPLAGAVYVYRWNAEHWSLVRTIDETDESGALFGASIALTRDVLVVGFPFGQGSLGATGNESKGSLHLFRRTGADVDPGGCSLEAPNADQCDAFASVVAATNDFIAAGAPFEDGAADTAEPDPDNGLLDAGAVYVYPVLH